MHKGPILDRVGDYRVINCDPCGFKHIDPLPTEAEQKELYASAYYSEAKPDYIEASLRDLNWLKLAWTHRLRRFRYFNNQADSILDIGCGPGLFLRTAVTKGWFVTGVEPAEQPRKFATSNNLSIYAELRDVTSKFDVVHLFNVLEHVVDPEQLLQEALKRLSSNGLICIGVPNDYNILQEKLRENGVAPWWLSPPHHINYFSFESIQRLMRSLGLEILDISTSFPMEIFLLMGVNYINKPLVGASCHKLRQKFDFALDDFGYYQQFYSLLPSLNLGREAIIIARKR